MAVAFLIVKCIMFQTYGNAVLLHLFNIRYAHLSGEERIFTHVLEISAVIRCPVNVYTRSEQYVFLAITCLFADALRSQVAARQLNAGKAVQESLVHPAWSHSFHFTSGRMP